MKRVIAIIMLINLFIMSVPNIITQAKETNNKDEIKKISGMNEKEINNTIKKIAKDENVTEERAAFEILRDMKAALPEQSKSGGGSDCNKKLFKAKERGDVYISRNAQIPVIAVFGHAGMYQKTDVVMMAPGPGKVTQTKNYLKEGVTSKTQIKRVKATQQYRDGAISWATKHLKKPYEFNFAYNKKSYKYVNCSSYVYFAYIHSLCAQKYWPKNNKGKRYRIALDHNGGPGVYPYDIKDSGWTELYKTIK